ncbi:MAG: hypothetical protein Q7S79_00480 [bacterium]|nr:hypothetical protein [bacterium]
MIELPHTIVGAAIATKIGNPALALPIALLSHFVLDLTPHWNPHLNKEIKEFGRITKRTTAIIVGDVVLSLISGFYLASLALPDTKKFIIILLCCFLAVLPDVAEGPHFFFGQRWRPVKKLVEFQSKMQFNVPLIPGLLSQALVIIAALWWIYQ